MQGKLHLTDLIEDRGWIDRWGFLLFAFFGAAAILIAKSAGITAIPVAAGAAILMVAYAFVVQTTGTGRLRADQAGDNCYYLGLIFTLTSLSYAIFLFDPSATATTIVQGFGVALATTIMGLVLRVFFNQSRVDLVQTEDTARVELAEAAGRLKAELQSMTVSMSDYGRETRQALEELRGQMVEALTTVQTEATRVVGEALSLTTNAINAVSADATAAVSQQSNDALARSRRLTTATDKVIASIEGHAEAMSGIEKSSTAIAASLSSLDAAAESMKFNLNEMKSRSSELAETQDALGSAAAGLRSTVETLSGNVQTFDETATRFDASVAARLDELAELPAILTDRAADALEAAASRVQERAEATASGHHDFIARLAARTDEGVAALERHNSTMEDHLGRSRDNVAKVHGALVEMTGKLAERVQAGA